MSGAEVIPGEIDGTTTGDDVSDPRKVLLLTIEVPGVWVDDLDENAAEYFGGDYLEAVLDSDCMGLNEQVGLTVLVEGDESGPMVHAYTCRVVGAATKDRS